MELKTIQVTKVYKNDKDKSGKPYITKAGKPYTRINVQCVEHGPEWLSAAAFRPDDPLMLLSEGQMVEVSLQKNGNYLNFSLPSRLDKLEMKIDKLGMEMENLKETAKKMGGISQTSKTPASAVESAPPDDLPDFSEDGLNF